MELRSIGGYVLAAPLGVGRGAARFYLARGMDESEQERPGFLAKVLLPGRSDSEATIQAQFEHEIALLRASNHPGIPTLHSAGDQDGVTFILMDYVDGVDLATLLGHHTDTPRGLSKEIAVYIMGQLSDALRHMHALEHRTEEGEYVQLAALHRDITPANVLLSREGDVLLCDFGAAYSALLPAEHDMTQAGSKAYMAPERVTGSGKATAQSDLFSMAVVLWEMLRGERCFQAGDDLGTMDAIVRFDISHSSRRVSGLSPKLSEIVRKNLDRDPGRRYTGAYQMLQRLSQSPEAKAAEQSRLDLARMVAEAADAASE
jgi:serine/threonine-protein kinase